MTNQLEELTNRLQPYILEINNHPLYSETLTLENVRFFMEQHVFAVWDFMCLLKELHRRIVCTGSPWFPPKDAFSANLITSILTEEESDLTETGEYASHYDTYLDAMRKVGADVSGIEELLNLLQQGLTIENALGQLRIKATTKKFVLTTFSFFDQSVHELAAAFVYGREGITSALFMPLVNQIEKKLEDYPDIDFSVLIYYCRRHIVLDDSEHFPKALQMLFNMIGNDKKKLQEVEAAAIKALNARLDFLTDIHHSLK